MLYMMGCSSISNLPITFGHMTSLNYLVMDLATKEQALAIAQLIVPLPNLVVSNCTDEAISVLDSLDALRSLHHLSTFYFNMCPSMTTFPKTIGLLENLGWLNLCDCDKLQKLPNSIGELKVLTRLLLRKFRSLKTLPDSLGALTHLRELWIVQCISFTTLPTSLGQLSSLRTLCIEGCAELQQLSECVKDLDRLEYLTRLDCGGLEGMGAVSTLQGHRIWGCTSTTELPRSCLIVLTSNIYNPASYVDLEDYHPAPRGLRELAVVEVNDCGLLRLVHEPYRNRVILQRVHNLPYCKLSMV